MNSKRPTMNHIISKMAKVKDKEDLKRSKRKVVMWLSTRELLLDCQLISQQKYFRPKKNGMRYTK